MFDKNKSSSVKKVLLNNKNSYKRIGTFLISFTLLTSMANSAKANDFLEKHLEYESNKHDYYVEKNKLEEQKSYGQEIVNLYKYGQVLIDNELYLLDKFYIAYKVTDNGYEFHLKCAGANYSDILNKELEEYDYDGIIKFKNSSAFINLIEHQDIVIDYANNIIVVTDNKILTNIIDNWDGMLHDRVSDTDAISDKNILKRRTGK